MPLQLEILEKKRKKGIPDVGKTDPASLKVAKVAYGTKELAECMESVIRIHQEGSY